MNPRACLVAGPLILDRLQGQDDLLGGSGFYAAAAAAPFAHTQLWARAGADFTPDLERVVTARHIDLAGLGREGPSLRFDHERRALAVDGPRLPDTEPESTAGLDAALVIALPPDEGRRALTALADLGERTARPLLVAPEREDLAADPTWLADCCRWASILLLPVASALETTGEQAPLAAARALQERGVKTVALSAGSLGGLVAYGQKVCTWSAQPSAITDQTGVGPAFAGALLGYLAEAGKADFRALKRGLAIASAVAAATGQGIGPKRLLAMDRGDYLDRFNRLRRTGKF